MTGDKEFQLLHVTRVVDGDTFDALVLDEDVGEIDGWQLSGEKVVRIRLVHLDTPEEGHEGYEEAKADLEDWLFGWDSMNGHLVVLAQQKKDSFGRYLADVYEPTDRARTASDYMLRQANKGHGWPAFIR